MEKKPLILITNDDGYRAKGLHKLIDLMCRLGRVIAVTTERPMSAQGHSITTSEPLRLHLFEKRENCEIYVTNGRPVDCVKLGYQVVTKERPDILVSGINHGSNASVNVVYSGTMGAVVEACMDNIPAIGFSLDNYAADANFDHLDSYIITITNKVLESGLPYGVCLNVNFPNASDEPIKGVKICRQATARWAEDFDHRIDPSGKDYYWLTGYFVNDDDGTDTDQYAIENNYVSVVPIKFDWTAYSMIDILKEWKL